MIIYFAVSLSLLAALGATAAIESRAATRARRDLDRLRHLAGVEGHGSERYGLWTKNDLE